MKDYLKMADVFDCEVESDADLMFSDSLGSIADFSGCKSQCRYASHAINSHDELVAMSQELLAALEAVIEWYDMESEHSIEPDFYKRIAACKISENMAREAIAKVKRGAA